MRILLVACLCLVVQIALADTLVMPRELVDAAHANRCDPINNFYNRPGMVNPPYVYGWLSGESEESAVFWCRSMGKSDKPYKLVIKVRNSKLLAGCPAAIEWWNFPGGLSIETPTELSLNAFHYVATPKRNGPRETIHQAKVIVSYYDGLTDVFYCHKGRWLFKSAE